MFFLSKSTDWRLFVLKKLLIKVHQQFNGIEATGFEPTTSASRTQRSTKLSHASILFQTFQPVNNSYYMTQR